MDEKIFLEHSILEAEMNIMNRMVSLNRSDEDSRSTDPRLNLINSRPKHSLDRLSDMKIENLKFRNHEDFPRWINEIHYLCKVSGLGPEIYEDPHFSPAFEQEPYYEEVMKKTLESLPTSWQGKLEDFSLFNIMGLVTYQRKTITPNPLELLNKLLSFKLSTTLKRNQAKKVFEEIKHVIFMFKQQNGNSDELFSQWTFINLMVRKWVAEDTALSALVGEFVQQREGSLGDLLESLEYEINLSNPVSREPSIHISKEEPDRISNGRYIINSPITIKRVPGPQRQNPPKGVSKKQIDKNRNNNNNNIIMCRHGDRCRFNERGTCNFGHVNNGPMRNNRSPEYSSDDDYY